jgi:hypothetical protein
MLEASCLPEIDYTGKVCSAESTCPSGWVCDQGHCGRSVATAPTPTATCTRTFEVKDFHAAWQTTNNIRWAWEPLGTVDTFGRYEIQMDATRERIEADNASVVLDAKTNVELGFMNLPATGGIEPVKASVAYGLTPPSSAWFGRLVAFDRYGCPFKSPVAPAQLLPTPSFEAALFRDALRVGDFLLPTAASASSHGRLAVRPDCDGSPCLEYTAETSGGENLLLNTSITPAELTSMTRGRFEQAFLEFRIWVDSEEALWTGVWLVNGSARVFRFEPYSPIRATKPPLQSNYRVVQVPLRKLVDSSGVELTRPDLDSGVVQFRFYAIFGAGARAWLDDIVLRW